MNRVFNFMSNRAAVLTLGAVAAAGSALAFAEKPTAKVIPVNLAVDERPVDRQEGGRTSFAPVVKKVSPGVVKVFSIAKVHNASMESPDMDDMLRRFFGDQFGGRLQRHGNMQPRREGIGSGVIVSKDGYILTNNHVVDGADELKVTLQDGRDFTAKVVGRDPKSDVAVIKIAAQDLPAVPMADSDKIEVGDIVLAIGNPFGIGQTVTTGIISAKDRGNMGIEDYEDFIQTDAAINPGNSGGALVDVDGRLIGINTAILSHSGGNQGIGFAIPVNLARDVMTSLVKDGHVTRGYLGVMIQDLTPGLAKEFKLDETSGALVGDVTPNSPAEKAGLKSGDVILEFDGKKVDDTRHLKLSVARTQPGETVPVKILRNGDTRTIQVTVREIPGSENLAKAEDNETKDTGTLNGVGVADLDHDARQQFNVPSGVNGVVITEVQPDSPSAEAGLKAGDIILEINRKPVSNAEEAVRMTEHPSEKVTLLRIWRDGGSRYVVVDESKNSN